MARKKIIEKWKQENNDGSGYKKKINVMAQVLAFVGGYKSTGVFKITDE